MAGGRSLLSVAGRCLLNEEVCPVARGYEGDTEVLSAREFARTDHEADWSERAMRERLRICLLATLPIDNLVSAQSCWS